MFLGFSPVITNWSAASDEFSLMLDNNPMAEFAELPEGHEGLLFSNILCGVLRGALEMVGLLPGIEMLTQKNQLLLTSVYTGDFCRGSLTQFLSR